MKITVHEFVVKKPTSCYKILHFSKHSINFMNQLNIKIHENWYLTNIYETAEYDFFSVCFNHLHRNKKLMIHFVFSSATVINRPEVHPKAAFWPLILLLMSPSFFVFFRSSFIGRNNIRYGHIGMAVVINIVSAAVRLIVLWIMKMFTCFFKEVSHFTMIKTNFHSL